MRILALLKEIKFRMDEKKRQRFLRELKKKGLRIGKNVFFASDIYIDPSHCYLVSIGDHCGFAPNVRLIAHDSSLKWLGLVGFTKIGRINIRENCFIGDSAIILPGVTIGPNTIVGAGAVVSKDAPPNCVVGGNPAKVICSIEETLDKIKELSKGKKIFNENYSIEKLDEFKRKEILHSVGESIGFIV